MTKDQLSNLYLNQRVKLWRLNKHFEEEILFGYVTKIYNGNGQIQVWFDGKTKPITVGYKNIMLV